MTGLLLLALVVAGPSQYEPASPTVGDHITVTFPDPGEGKLSLLPSDEFEVLEVAGDKAVVRSFRPGEIRVVGEVLTPGRQTQRHTVDIEVRSVLAENDDLQPAPLVLPKQIPPNKTVAWAIGGVAVAALLIWTLLFFVSKRFAAATGEGEVGAQDVASRFLTRLDRISRLRDEEERWRELAESTRWLLQEVEPSLGRELTTSEVLVVMDERRFDTPIISVVDHVLHGGDWAKFSPFGAPNEGSTSILDRARDLAKLAAKSEVA